MARSLKALKQAMVELRHRISIDKNALDEEITQQPQCFYDASDLLAEIHNARDALKEELEVLGAEIQTELREQYEREQSKYTDKSVTAQVVTDPDYVKLNDEYRLYRALSTRALALQSAFETKTRMLAHLARLFIASYYSDPTTSAPPDQADEVRARRGRQAATEKRNQLGAR
jgi:hypothetical protein